MVKHECADCGAVWRAAAKWGDSIACPFCATALNGEG
jgi:DNA-directed RNA polymerase subunit RPC12/RpoP